MRAERNSIPRVPWELLHNWNAISVVESDLFRLLIIDAYAFTINGTTYTGWSNIASTWSVEA